ncbi:amylo-alpha-1,6-glucosidase [Spirilliplanes yamanashiensis]|uniref:Glycogen debranching protein n=1 Tax=Spirilliplanes yamanashiensis TaxID=42233 RepID=A0A8J3Y7Y6_9ACTN|nr:amylo-alpha-1,6-glucosidase [Spirilliplanes yamanashiensis]MDP9817177.1 putative glycogen debranching enzyme [Spirilliplanes yamanashiensis]GIJ03170.1 glycogen debranching protein [Spirilliplanes yamanashiensis]
MIPISFGPQVCGDPAAGGAREWLLPDGLGGYAMGTVSGLRTRRYHGLLVVAGATPASRRLALAALDATLTLPSGATVRLGTHEWASGAVEPRGHELLSGFTLADGLPRWRWRVGDTVVERELAMTHGRPAVAVVHRLVAGGPVGLTLEALCTWRDAHGERTAAGPPPTVEPAADGCVVAGAYRLTGPGVRPAGRWWRGVHHREEAARGLNPGEDLWHAGSFHTTLTAPGDAAQVTAWAGDATALADRPAPPVEVVAAARRRHRAVVAAARPADDLTASLALAADAFVVRTPAGPDVVAGYPWFGAWSRDTMISYEGLFLATGRADAGADLLRSYAATLSEGMLANTADTGAVEYNTVDGTLWFLHAVGRHVAATGDTGLAADLLPGLRAVVGAHLAGTRYGIRADPADGLLTQGADGEALTWMDARVDGVPVTQRRGKPVEVNALWVNALAVVADLAARTRGDAGPAARAHEAAVAGFRRRFPAPHGLLYDVVDGPGGDDPALRPNQLLAWSLPHAPLRPEPEALRRVAGALLTPVGLRSLAPAERGFTGRHRGTGAARDAAYHQGTVWPWLAGPYRDAARRCGLTDDEAPAATAAHLAEWGLGSVSETADGDPPHAATGCPFQAWSVAEALRTLRTG